MPKLSSQEIERRRSVILDGARHVLATHGFEGATVRRLEEHTGLSRGAIFHHFGDKVGLFVALARRDADEAARRLASEGVFRTLHWLLGEDPDWFANYAELGRLYRTDEDFRERWDDRGAPIDEALPAAIAAAQARGEIGAGLSVDVVSRLIGLLADGIVNQRAGLGEVDYGREAIDLLEELLRP